MTHLSTWFVTSLVMSLMMTSVVVTSKTVVLKDIKQQIEKTRRELVLFCARPAQNFRIKKNYRRKTLERRLYLLQSQGW